MIRKKITVAIMAGITAIWSLTVSAQPDNATHIPVSEIMTVFENLGRND